MGVLEEVTNMKNQGMDDTTITNALREKGISPGEINDAFSQSQIKNAVSQEQMTPPTPQAATTAGSPYTPQTIEAGESPYSPPQDLYTPQTSEQAYAPEPKESYAPSNDYAPQQEYYPQEGYQEYSQGTGTDTMIEVAEQVFFEKIQKLQKTVDKLEQFKTLSETKLDSVENRLKKIENIIDKLQISILNKVGSYAKGFDSIKKEMNMIEDSFGKVISAARPKPQTQSPSPVKKTSTKKTTAKKKTVKKKTSKTKKK